MSSSASTSASSSPSSSPSSSSSDPASPITLVHGAFGAGKSHLLVTIVCVLCSILEQIDPEHTVRILVASQTNVAVDNILLGLLDRGFKAFTRVGSIKKIAKPILKHTLHDNGQGKGDQANDNHAVKELQHMLKTAAASSGAEVMHIQQAINEIRSSKAGKRAKRLRYVRGGCYPACVFTRSLARLTCLRVYH